jgi:hypothetical protein
MLFYLHNQEILKGYKIDIKNYTEGKLIQP